jgi:hypothetical protein
MNRLLTVGVVLSSGLAFAAQRESAGSGCCSLIVFGLLVFVFRSGGADWLRAVGAAAFPGLFGWFIWRDRELGTGARWVALVMAVLQLFFMVVAVVVVAVLTGALARAHPETLSPGEKVQLYREGFVRRCAASHPKAVCECIAEKATARDERDRKELAFNLQKGALEEWLSATRQACAAANPVSEAAPAAVKEDDSLGLHPKSRITSDPPGATVFVNGEERGKTPLETPLTAGQNNEVKVVLSGYFTELVSRQPNAKERFELRFTLKAAAQLDVRSTPPGAKVTVGLKPVVARTPGLSDSLEPGESEVVVSLDGYQASSQPMTLVTGLNPLEVTLEPGVKVSVTSTPSEGAVLVDGRLVGLTPLDVFIAPKGKHTVEVKKDSWAPAKKVFSSLSKPAVFAARLTDTGLILAQRALATARAKYERAEAALEKHQQKMERSYGAQLDKLEKGLPPLEREMEKASLALEKAEAEVKRIEEERGIVPAPKKGE